MLFNHKKDTPLALGVRDMVYLMLFFTTNNNTLLDFLSTGVFCYNHGMSICSKKDCQEPILRPHGYSLMCPKHHQESKKKITPTKTFGFIDNTRYAGTKMNESHYKHLNTRAVNDEGQSVSGKEGLEYMKSKGSLYASRLKDYYK